MEHFQGTINFQWYGNPLQTQYHTSAFAGPISFLRGIQVDPNIKIIFWCQSDYKSKVQKYFEAQVKQHKLKLIPGQFEVKSIEDDLLNQLLAQGHVIPAEILKIKTLLATISHYQDYVFGKDLIMPLILLAQGGYAFDTTIYLDSTSQLLLPSIPTDLGYTWHNGDKLRIEPTLDVYCYSSKNPNNPIVKTLAFLHLEIFAKFYLKDAASIGDHYGYYPTEHMIFDSERFLITPEMRSLFLSKTFNSKVKFHPRCILDKSSYGSLVRPGFHSFVDKVVIMATRAPWYVAQYLAEHSYKIEFKEFPSRTTMSLKGIDAVMHKEGYSTIRKTFGQTKWVFKSQDAAHIKERKLFKIVYTFIKNFTVSLFYLIMSIFPSGKNNSSSDPKATPSVSPLLHSAYIPSPMDPKSLSLAENLSSSIQPPAIASDSHRCTQSLT